MTHPLDEIFSVPQPSNWHVDWPALDLRFPWIRAMRKVPQDPKWHAEGDVWIHTRMVCEQMVALAEWRSLSPSRRRRLWLAALLHDVAKPHSTRIIDGRVRSPHHSPRGAVLARQILWQLGVDRAEREHIAGLVRHHQLPLHALEENGEQRVTAASYRCSMADLAILAEADIRGRICEDQPSQLESITLFGELARDLGCWDQARVFPSDHTRFLFFRENRPASVKAYDDTECTVTLLCGFPAAGKTHWRKHQRQASPVICLDEIRIELGVDPADNQGDVLRVAKDRARTFLRKQQDFIWDATNLTRQRRNKLVDLFYSYRARIEMIAFDLPPALLFERNRARQRQVPQKIIDAMAARWEAPDETEAHSVCWIDAG